MEDSGIDSEDKLSYQIDLCEQDPKLDQHSDDEADGDDDDEDLQVKFHGTKDTADNINKFNDNTKILNNQPSSCRVLQRKLELKVERAKKNYNRYQQDNSAIKSKSSNLIPINRLQIPGYSENQPLVDYKSDSGDDVDEISFFPSNKFKHCVKQELSDTFSLQEMTIESENSDDSGSQNLELLPPLSSKSKVLDKLLNCFCCSSKYNVNEID